MRLLLRLVLYLVATVAVAYLLFWALLGVGVVVFDTGTPECTDSDSCGAWGNFFYNTWPGGVICLAVGAAVAWRVVPRR